MPRKQRDSFVATAIRRAAPFPAPGWRIAWHENRAMVWVWPQDQLTDPESQLAVAQSPAPQRFVPETLLRGSVPAEDAVELVRCSDGVEARAWRGGDLRASRWWPDTPGDSEWVAFCRSAGFVPPTLPQVQEWPWRDEPWTSTRDVSLGDALARSQRLVWPLACALVILVAAYQVAALVHIEFARQAVAGEIERDSARVSDVLAQRNRADEDLATIHALLALRPPVPQVDLMARVAQLLDTQHAKVVKWSMPDPTSLEVEVSMPAPNPRALVLAFQRTGLFTNVGADIARGGENQLIIRARVGTAQPAGAGSTS